MFLCVSKYLPNAIFFLSCMQIYFIKYDSIVVNGESRRVLHRLFGIAELALYSPQCSNFFNYIVLFNNTLVIEQPTGQLRLLGYTSGCYVRHIYYGYITVICEVM